MSEREGRRSKTIGRMPGQAIVWEARRPKSKVHLVNEILSVFENRKNYFQNYFTVKYFTLP